jgi:hypothetical protein
VQDWIPEAFADRARPSGRVRSAKAFSVTPPNTPANCIGDKMIAAPVKQSA